jgi:hypothetical protein
MGSLLMIVISGVPFSTQRVVRPFKGQKLLASVLLAFVVLVGPSHAQDSNQAAFTAVDENGYKLLADGESEFDNQSDTYVKDWREAYPVDEYEDTDFGDFIYNEASTPTKLEVLRLLSKDTPSLLVFMTAISMGLGIDSVLQASVKYEPEKGRDLAASAVSLLPVLQESKHYVYSAYGLEDLEREDEDPEDDKYEVEPYSVEEVVDKFFDDRLVLRPYPDWHEGQFHFMASAAELKRLQAPQKDVRWYRSKTTEDNETRRPIFVSLYEATSSVLIDGEERIDRALRADPNAILPVVFIFNRLNERAIDELGYPITIKGLHRAYSEKQLMLTPTPEWQLGEYHAYGSMDEIYDIFTIPSEEDFEPEAWQKLLDEAEDYSVTNTAFLFVVVGSPDDKDEETESEKDTGDDSNVSRMVHHQQIYAAWDDPRTESAFPFVEPEKDAPALTLKNLVGQGLIFNRPDLIAALNALGVKKVPVVFYYNDSARVKPYIKGPRSLIQAALGVTHPSGTFGGSGGLLCASPPCTEEPQ